MSSTRNVAKIINQSNTSNHEKKWSPTRNVFASSPSTFPLTPVKIPHMPSTTLMMLMSRMPLLPHLWLMLDAALTSEPHTLSTLQRHTLFTLHRIHWQSKPPPSLPYNLISLAAMWYRRKEDARSPTPYYPLHGHWGLHMKHNINLLEEESTPRTTIPTCSFHSRPHCATPVDWPIRSTFCFSRLVHSQPLYTWISEVEIV